MIGGFRGAHDLVQVFFEMRGGVSLARLMNQGGENHRQFDFIEVVEKKSLMHFRNHEFIAVNPGREFTFGRELVFRDVTGLFQKSQFPADKFEADLAALL